LAWRVATRAASLATVGALAVDIALVETGMVENGFQEQMQQILSRKLWVIRSKYVGLDVGIVNWRFNNGSNVDQ
jgi:hypothetical protein